MTKVLYFPITFVASYSIETARLFLNFNKSTLQIIHIDSRAVSYRFMRLAQTFLSHIIPFNG